MSKDSEKVEEDKKDEGDKIEVKLDNDDNKSDKALFVQRLFAFAIDFFIVYMCVSLISYPFMDNKKIESLTEDYTNVTQNYIDQKIESNEYLSEAMNISYSLTRLNGVNSIITIVFYVLYFVVFQLYNHGQTIGKKIMKIKVVSDNGDLTMNQMIFRGFIANSILLKIISFALFIFTSRSVYFDCLGLFNFTQYVIIIASIFMVMFRKDGLAIHDLLVHTKVIKKD